jgi:hypothetical protein
MRALRELEPPAADEGFAEVERMEFERAARSGAPAIFIAAAAALRHGWEHARELADPAEPHLVFDWSPDADRRPLERAAARVEAGVEGPVEAALCPHPAGPPVCWCRPPLPGLPLAFARAHGVDPARSVVVGTSPAHKTLATTLGARYLQA